MTQYREDGRLERISKTRDRIFTDEADGATAWLSCQPGGTLTVTVNKGYLSGSPLSRQMLRMITTADFPNAVVVLERKLATQADDEAQLVDQFRQTSVFANVKIQQPGYYRLRVREISVVNDPMGVVIELSVLPAKTGVGS